MNWLELRTHEDNYSFGWNQTQAVWAPTRKKNSSKWPFWSLVQNVTSGDLIFHIKQSAGVKRFIGYSTAVNDGFITKASPSKNQFEWDFSREFYKVDLTNFCPFIPEIRVEDYFRENEIYLREYYEKNKADLANHRHLFYTIQSGKLQCLFGAYFSEFTESLIGVLKKEFITILNTPEIHSTTNTSSILTTLAQRIGQQKFSENVKKNYGEQCCYPGCDIKGKGFLIAGHIDRWADNEKLRGATGNGLCLCLMHDKAFEKGLFTINEEFRVVLLKRGFISANNWLSKLLIQGEGQPIKSRIVDPLKEALEAHWIRVGYR